jgi:hypothetical protein
MADFTSLLNTLNSAALTAFGREVTYSPQTGTPSAIRAIFQPSHETEENSPGVYGVMFIRLTDLAKPPERGDEVSMDRTLYKVFDIEADTSGGAVLRLRQT